MIALRAAGDRGVLAGVCSTVDAVGPEAVFLLSQAQSELPRVVAEELAAASLREAMSFRRSWSDGVTA